MNKDFEDILLTGEFRKTKKRKGKPKGNSFERKLAKELNDRFKTKEFTRSPGSGGFATSHINLPEHMQVQGDLITPLNFRFVIEAKCGYDLNINSLFSKKSKLYEFIRQSKKEKELSKKEWLLIYKKDYCDPIVFMENNKKETKLNVSNFFVLQNKIICCPWKDLLQQPDDFFFNS